VDSDGLEVEANSHVSSKSHPYANKKVVLTTKHNKHHLIAPILKDELGIQLMLHEADTDQFGTFSGEVERTLSPRAAAIAKAKLGIRGSGRVIGIASEGSIGRDPRNPFIQSDIEYVALVDSELQIEIVESYRSLNIIAGQAVVTPDFDLTKFLAEVDFPNHKLIAQANDRLTDPIKGIETADQLEKAINELATKSSDAKVLLQSDLRAHCSPSRQQNIIQAAKNLAKRVGSLCPSCNCPGFGVTHFEKGLECSDCGELVSTAAKYEISGCVRCSFEQTGPLLADYADPSSCQGCNP
jgi:hypothetical protein